MVSRAVICKAVVGVAICLTVMFGLWVTKDASCLWGLFFIGAIKDEPLIQLGGGGKVGDDE